MYYKADNLVTSRYKTSYDLVCLSVAKSHRRIFNEELGRIKKWTVVAYFNPYPANVENMVSS
jgi:hypothetical protein